MAMSTLPRQAPSIRTCMTRSPPASTTAMFIGCPISAARASPAATMRRASFRDKPFTFSGTRDPPRRTPARGPADGCHGVPDPAEAFEPDPRRVVTEVDERRGGALDEGGGAAHEHPRPRRGREGLRLQHAAVDPAGQTPPVGGCLPGERDRRLRPQDVAGEDVV